MGLETIGEVWAGSRDPRGSPGRVERPSERSGTGDPPEVRNETGTIGEVQDGSRDPRGGPGRVERPSGKTGTGLETLGEVRDGSGDPPKVRNRTGTLVKVRNG